jgi:hypothetical protein
VAGSLTSAILFAFCATSTAASVLEEWRVGSLADPQEAHLMRAALEGRHAGIQQSEREVRWLQAAILLQSGDSLEYLVMSGEG